MMDLEFRLNHHRFKVLYLNFCNFIHVISNLKYYYNLKNIYSLNNNI